ncbi:MAG: PAS domain-containing protein [Rhizomicrobium sp.]|jgi:hypothetical protein
MKQASSRELFGYWAARRGKRAAPERGEIEPSAIRRALGDVFILEFDPRVGHPFRLGGTRVCALFGRELKNESFLDLWDDETRAQVAQLLAIVADEVSGIVAGVKGRTGEGWPQDLELVLLPLSQRGDTHARMIGALTPFNAPFWLGVSRLGALTLGNVRHLDPARELPTAARLVAATQRPARRAVFTVYDGGRV